MLKKQNKTPFKAAGKKKLSNKVDLHTKNTFLRVSVLKLLTVL